MSLEAYQKTQRSTETPSQTEYRVFAKVTRALIEAKGLPHTDQRLHNALHDNRRLWSVLATDCAVEGNQQPNALRAQIISLSIWVGKYSSLVARGQEDIDALISVNKNIMDGLAAQAANAKQPVTDAQDPKPTFTSTTV